MCQPDQENFVTVFGRRLALRCTAHSKRSGKRCCGFAVNGFSVCRMHGARGGPKTEAGLGRIAVAQLVHGRETREIRLTRQAIRAKLNSAIVLGLLLEMFGENKKKSRTRQLRSAVR
jgi:hypothetical protein